MKRATKTAKRDRKTNAAGRKLVAAVREMHEAVTSGNYSGLTIRTVEIREPSEYDAQSIRRLRGQLRVSQSVFARLMGVSSELVESWEQGIVSPRAIARRLMDQIVEDPSRFLSSHIRRAG